MIDRSNSYNKQVGSIEQNGTSREGMPMNVEQRTEAAARAQLLSITRPLSFRADYPNYVHQHADNLVAGVSVDDFWADFEGAAGSELIGRNGEPPKFCAVRSSAALAVNCFGPFRHHPERLELAGLTGFSQARFEAKCKNGLRTRTPPHLDFLAESASAVVAVESKFLEPLAANPKPAEFAAQYEKRLKTPSGKQPAAEEPWIRAFERLKKEPKRYHHLNAAQLVKHYLGLRHSYAERPCTLLYLYWEPTNAQAFDEFRTHRAEIADFAALVAGGQTRFRALDYPALWQEWVARPHWDAVSTHVGRLRER